MPSLPAGGGQGIPGRVMTHIHEQVSGSMSGQRVRIDRIVYIQRRERTIRVFEATIEVACCMAGHLGSMLTSMKYSLVEPESSSTEQDDHNRCLR